MVTGTFSCPQTQTQPRIHKLMSFHHHLGWPEGMVHGEISTLISLTELLDEHMI